MKNIRKLFVKSKQYIKQKIQTIYQKQAQYVTQKHQPSSNLIQNITKLKFNKMEYPELDKYMIKFFNSKPIEGRVSGKSLLFVVGAQHVGKSDFIQKSYKQIKKRKLQVESQFNPYSLTANNKYPQFLLTKSPQYLETQIQQNVFDNQYNVIVKMNYQQRLGNLNFINFIQDLHDQIEDKLFQLLVKFEERENKKSTVYLPSNKSKKNSNSTNSNELNSKQTPSMTLLTPQIIKEIVTHSNAPQYIFMYVKDVVFAILQDKDPIRLSKDHKQILQKFNDEILTQCTCEQFFNSHYLNLIDILYKTKAQVFSKYLKNSDQIQRTYVAYIFFNSVFKRIQYQNRPSQFVSSWYQNGIQTTNYLFDLLNFISGLGPYLQSIQKEYKSSQTSPSERKQIKQKLQNSNNFILLGNHVDVSLCLMNLEKLKCFQFKQKKFLDFYDHLICRTINQSNFRKHFPIVIQIPNRAFLDETLQLGKIQGSNPVILQIPGYNQTLLKFSNLIQLFTLKQSKKLFPQFGRNPYTWKTAIECMAKGQSLQSITEGTSEYLQKQRLKIQAKFNRIYLNPNCIKYLNSQTLDFQLLQVIKLFTKMKGMGTTIYSIYASLMFKQPYFQVMAQQNIFYHMYYMPYIDYSVHLPLYNYVFGTRIKQELKKKRSWLGYKLWKYRNKEFSIFARQIRYSYDRQHVMHERQGFGKDHLDLQLYTTYYGPLKDYKYEYGTYGYTAHDSP